MLIAHALAAYCCCCAIGIQAAISKSKKNIAPKLYVRIKEIKRKINALEVSRDSFLHDSDLTLKENSSQEIVMEEDIAVDGQPKSSSDIDFLIKSTYFEQAVDSSKNRTESSSVIDTESNHLKRKIDTNSIEESRNDYDIHNETDNENDDSNGRHRKNKEHEKKRSRTIMKLKEKNNREEFMLKKADALLDKINIKVGIEGRPLEQTWERVILAEKMRIGLSRYCISEVENDKKFDNDEDSISCGELYTEYINGNYNLHRIHVV